MTIGSWEPQATTDSPTLDADLLRRLASYDDDDHLDRLDTLLEPALQPLMRIDHEQWRTCVEPLDSAVITSLIRVLTLAENIPGFEAGEHSPVIALAKILRQRGERLPKEQLLWIRENSENRYLPYGPL